MIIDGQIKKQEVLDLLVWGLYYGDLDVKRLTAYVLSYKLIHSTKKIILDALMDNELSPDVKIILTYVLIVKGYKNKINIVFQDRLVCIKPNKFDFEKQDLSGVYLSAYALIISRTLALSISRDKIADVISKLYRKAGKIITDSEVSNEELAGFVLYLSNFKELSEKDIRKHFAITKDKLDRLKLIYKGVKDD